MERSVIKILSEYIEDSVGFNIYRRVDSVETIKVSNIERVLMKHMIQPIFIELKGNKLQYNLIVVETPIKAIIVGADVTKKDDIEVVIELRQKLSNLFDRLGDGKIVKVHVVTRVQDTDVSSYTNIIEYIPL